MTKQNLKIEQLKPEKLTTYIGNARTHTPEQVGQIAGSIVEFGFVNPILIGEDDVIIAGHGRLLAAQKLGLETVPVIRLDHLSKAQRQALVLADNKIAENAGWDENLLRLELQALEEVDFDLGMIGFSETELDELFAGLDDEDNIEGENEVSDSKKEFILENGWHYPMTVTQATDYNQYIACISKALNIQTEKDKRLGKGQQGV